MLVIFGFSPPDSAQALEWMGWCAELRGCPNHDLILVCDAATDWATSRNILELGCKSFRTCRIVTNDISVNGWAEGANSLFKVALIEAKAQQSPFLWLEPDAIPLKSGWLDAIEAEYRACGKPFMGGFVTSESKTAPGVHLEGVACYPWNALDILEPIWNSATPWVVFGRDVMLPLAHDAKTIAQFWGPSRALAPIFSKVKDPTKENSVTLDFIRPGAVLWHRNKDGSLIRLLRDKAGLNVQDELLYVFPFCWMDADLMFRHLEWMQRLCGKINRTAVLHFDETVPVQTQGRLMAIGSQIFKHTHVSRYPQNQAYQGWPAAPNWAFQRAVDRMRAFNRPWFWMEADAIALTPDWFWRLESEYVKGGKPFMGPIVGDFDGLKMGHFNGGSVYPGNISDYSDAIMTCKRQAWDTAFRDEIGRDGIMQVCHPVNHLIQQCGAVVNGCCKPINGPLATFPDQATVDRLVHKTSVVFHPIKNTSLADRLTERL